MEYPFMVIDGNALAYRSIFSGARDMRAPDGTPTGGLATFLKTIKKLLRERPPKYLVICFDGPREELERKKLYPQYKEGRSGLTDQDFDQLDLIIKALQRTDVKIFRAVGYEADDVMATLAARHRDKMGVCIVTPDKDLHQCVRDNVVCFDPKSNTTITRATVNAVWGIEPEQICDFQAVTGDPTDNVPGVPGVGPKTAKALFDSYHTLDGIIAALDRLPERLRRNFKSTNLDLMLRLVSLDETLELDIPLNECAYVAPLATPALQAHLEFLGFKER